MVGLRLLFEAEEFFIDTVEQACRSLYSRFPYI